MTATVLSARDAPVVFGSQATEPVPERFCLLAAKARGQHVEMRVPAGADADHHATGGQAAVDHGQQHLLAPRFERKSYVAVVLSPGEGEFARRIDLDDPALHPMLLAKALRPLARRV